MNDAAPECGFRCRHCGRSAIARETASGTFRTYPPVRSFGGRAVTANGFGCAFLDVFQCKRTSRGELRSATRLWRCRPLRHFAVQSRNPARRRRTQSSDTNLLSQLAELVHSSGIQEMDLLNSPAPSDLDGLATKLFRACARFCGQSKVKELIPNAAVPLPIPHRHILNHLNIFPVQLALPFWTVGNIEVISRVDISNEARNTLFVRDGSRTSTVWLKQKYGLRTISRC